MLSIPAPATDPLVLADWLEVRALLADDQNASFSDLRRELARMGISEDEEEIDEAIAEERFAEDAFSELEDRMMACGEGYPFDIDNSVLQAKKDLSPYWAYVFCLFLSYRGASRGKTEKQPTLLFEDVAAIAAKKYISGESINFGFPRRILPKNFTDALSNVCGLLGEGCGPRQRPSSRHAKDAQLDLIAWRSFPDRRQAKMILFGQCAAGANWEGKLSELQPRNFIDLYLLEAPAVDPLRCFFTPFRLRRQDWYEKAKQAGILFDRCRISYFTHGHEPPPHLTQWNDMARKEIKGS
jgi:hypothetical protein